MVCPASPYPNRACCRACAFGIHDNAFFPRYRSPWPPRPALPTLPVIKGHAEMIGELHRIVGHGDVGTTLAPYEVRIVGTK